MHRKAHQRGIGGQGGVDIDLQQRTRHQHHRQRGRAHETGADHQRHPACAARCLRVACAHVIADPDGRRLRRSERDLEGERRKI